MSRVLIPLFSIFSLAGCLRTDCVNTIHQELVSPDGSKKIIIFSRDCGATTSGINTQASVLAKNDRLPNDGGNIFVVDKGTASVSWKKDGGILIMIESGARVFKKESSVGDIIIEYRE